MFSKKATLEKLNVQNPPNMVSWLGIEYTEIGQDYLCARMPVDERTKQPLGLLHGGASVVLAETLGSVAANLCVGDDQYCVGMEINANHIRSARGGFVHGKTTPIHIGRNSHVWHIEIKDDQGKLVCISRITMAVMDKPK